uniref:Membrane-bound metal-dependent hydrolase n=1 Tax=Magnetococcus massalia (strain MO-1) TaxID=451514 RepID=A0A1S7LFX2_MAGMO|nr:conserved protein of unknown function [Candidatus Magnetococcus massalia]
MDQINCAGEFTDMADFHTHLAVGAVASGLGATALYGAGLAGPAEVALFFSCGTVASLLPDIDADNATILSVVFTFVSVLLAFGVLFGHPQSHDLSGIELFLLWGALFAAMRVGVFELFTRMTVHRGIFHSVPAALLFGALVVLMLHYAFHIGLITAWVAGAFIMVGFIVHLLLDELYSLNLLSTSGPKKSLGSAFKFWSKDLHATLALYGATVLTLWVTPRPTGMLEPTLYSWAWHAIGQGWWP